MYHIFVFLYLYIFFVFFFFFFFNDTATTEIYTLSLHDALPICSAWNTETVPKSATTRRSTNTGMSAPIFGSVKECLVWRSSRGSRLMRIMDPPIEAPDRWRR